MDSMPADLGFLMEADKLLAADLFATVAGLALTASAFAFTAAAVLEDSAGRFKLAGGPENELKGDNLRKDRKSVLTAGIFLIGAFFFFVAGLAFVLGFDSWGEQALNSAVDAKDYADARGVEIGETVSAGSMLLAGFGFLVTGAAKLLSAFVSFRRS